MTRNTASCRQCSILFLVKVRVKKKKTPKTYTSVCPVERGLRAAYRLHFYYPGRRENENPFRAEDTVVEAVRRRVSDRQAQWVPRVKYCNLINPKFVVFARFVVSLIRQWILPGFFTADIHMRVCVTKNAFRIIADRGVLLFFSRPPYWNKNVSAPARRVFTTLPQYRCWYLPRLLCTVTVSSILTTNSSIYESATTDCCRVTFVYLLSLSSSTDIIIIIIIFIVTEVWMGVTILWMSVALRGTYSGSVTFHDRR
jgi:hypothetical protein